MVRAWGLIGMSSKPLAHVDRGDEAQGQTVRLTPDLSTPGDGSAPTLPSPGLEKSDRDLSALIGDARAVDLVLAVVQRLVGREPDVTEPTASLYAGLDGRISRLEKAVRAIVHGQGFHETSEMSRPSSPTTRVPLPERQRPESLHPLSTRTSGDRPLAMPDTIPAGGEGGPSRSPYLDAEQAAVYLGVTLNSLYGIVERGHLQPLRGPRRRYRFTTAMLDEYLGRKGGER
jgi:excisionase family DNA binding protein